MRLRITLALLAALTALLVAMTPAAAKLLVSGHNVPSEMAAGETFDVRFELEAHGDTLQAITDMTVVARGLGNQGEFTFPTAQDGDAWVAQVTLPEPGQWVLLVQSDELGFQQDLASLTALENAAAPATMGQLQRELDTLRAEFAKQVDAAVYAETKGLGSEQLALQKQVDSLLAEQEALRAELVALAATNAEQGTGLTLSWWLAGAFAILVAAVAAGGALVIASRRGLPIRLPARSTAH